MFFFNGLKKSFTVFCGIVTLSFYAQAGGVDGGGGKSVVCYNGDGTIKSAELLDLYEGRVQYKFPIVSRSVDIMEQAEKALELLGSGRDEVFRENWLRYQLRYVSANLNILPDGTALEEIDDSHHVVVPRDCKVIQLANFTDKKEILIDGEIWRHLDNTNKAALLVHEALYWTFRMFGATNSVRARQSTSFAFAYHSSGVSLEPVFEGVPADAWQCHTAPNEDGSPFPGSSFKAYTDSEGIMHFRFDYYEGNLVLTKADLYVDKMHPRDMNKAEETTYWLNLNSILDNRAGMVLSFKKVTINGRDYVEKKIGEGVMPSGASRVFYCAQ